MAAENAVSIEEQIRLHPHVPVELLRYVAGQGLTYAAWRERDLAWERRFWARRHNGGRSRTPERRRNRSPVQALTPEKSLPIARARVRDPLEDLVD